jgi:hypothetical protein
MDPNHTNTYLGACREGRLDRGSRYTIDMRDPQGFEGMGQKFVTIH